MPLVSSRSLRPLLTQPGRWAIPAHVVAGRRVGGYKYISIQQTPATDTTKIDVRGQSLSASSPDASFEILGTPYSILSVSLSPSQELHTRRGSLVGITGNPDDVVSTLRILNPVRRMLVGIPFLYQRITSTAPFSALISTKSTSTSFAILQLDGTTDWKLAQRRALLAWTGKTLSVTPSINQHLSLAYWGSSDVTGRGLLALVGTGQIYAVDLAEGESYTIHPSSVLAYATSGTNPQKPAPLPQPYRFKSSHVRFQIPLALGNWFPDSAFIRNIKMSDTWKFVSRITLRMKTWSRRTIWGDRLFLRFEGPTTILVQSRAARVSEVLTQEQVNEVADAPPGAVQRTVRSIAVAEEALASRPKAPAIASKPDSARMGVEGAMSSSQTYPVAEKDTKLNVAGVAPDGKVTFAATTKDAQVPSQNRPQ